MFGLSFGKPKEENQGEGPVQEYSADRLIEMTDDDSELAEAMREYLPLLHYVSQGQGAPGDGEKLKEAEKKFVLHWLVRGRLLRLKKHRLTLCAM